MQIIATTKCSAALPSVLQPGAQEAELRTDLEDYLQLKVTTKYFSNLENYLQVKVTTKYFSDLEDYLQVKVTTKYFSDLEDYSVTKTLDGSIFLKRPALDQLHLIE